MSMFELYQIQDQDPGQFEISTKNVTLIFFGQAIFNTNLSLNFRVISTIETDPEPES